MSQPEQKIVSFPISLGTVRLMFTKVDNVWTCNLADEFMHDLESALDGKIPQERVKWVDMPNFGADSGTDLS